MAGGRGRPPRRHPACGWACRRSSAAPLLTHWVPAPPDEEHQVDRMLAPARRRRRAVAAARRCTARGPRRRPDVARRARPVRPATPSWRPARAARRAASPPSASPPSSAARRRRADRRGHGHRARGATWSRRSPATSGADDVTGPRPRRPGGGARRRRGGRRQQLRRRAPRRRRRRARWSSCSPAPRPSTSTAPRSTRAEVLTRPVDLRARAASSCARSTRSAWRSRPDEVARRRVAPCCRGGGRRERRMVEHTDDGRYVVDRRPAVARHRPGDPRGRRRGPAPLADGRPPRRGHRDARGRHRG